MKKLVGSMMLLESLMMTNGFLGDFMSTHHPSLDTLLWLYEAKLIAL